jgi:6-phosphogluconolactonase (cycloisomerase 2 family)
MKRSLILALAVVLEILFGAPQFVRAQSCDTTSTIYWTGGAGDGQWTTKGNWSTGAVPGLSDNVCINPSFSVTAAGAGIDINSLNLLGTLTITNSAGMNLHSTAITSTLTNLTVGTNSGLFITGSATFPGSVTLASGGTIGGNNSLNSGTATFTGAVMVTANSALTVPTINNQGSITITQPSVLTLGSDGTFNNQAAGAVNIQADGVTINFSGTFNNAGTFAKTEGTGSSNIDMLEASDFVNTGTVVANSGTLVLNLSPSTSGNTSTGAFNAAGGATLSFAGGNITLNAKTTFGGSGTIDFSSGVWTVSAPITVTTANLILNGGTVMGSSTLTLDSGTLTTWNSGFLELSGTGAKVTLSEGKTMLIASLGIHSLSCELDVLGTVNQNTSGVLINDLSLNNATITIEHGARFNLQSDGGIHGSGSISDLGTFEKTGGTGISDVDYNGTFTITRNVTLVEVGTVAVSKGTLNFANSGGGYFLGTVTVGSGATLQFSAGTYSVEDATEFKGAGTTLISSVGSWNLQPSAGIPAGISVDTEVFQLNGVTGSSVIQGVGDLNANSKKFNFTGGEMTGTGEVSIPKGVTLSISTGPVYILGQTVSNSGVAQITDTARLYLGSGAVWTNNATGEFIFKADGNISDGGNGATFNNSGTVQKTGGTSTLGSHIDFTGTFNNVGTVSAAVGLLEMLSSQGTSDGGTFTAANKGAELVFGGPSQWIIGAGTSMTGKGEIAMEGSTWNLTADLTVDSAIFSIVGGTVNGAFNFTLASPSITLAGGLRQGVLQSGQPTGTIIIQNATSAPKVTVSGSFTIDASTMDNYGAMTINGAGAVIIQDAALLVNESGHTITLDKPIANSSAAIIVNVADGFSNSGTLTLGIDSGANLTQTIGGAASFNNYGTITIPKGHDLDAYGCNDYGTTILNAGTVTTTGVPFSIFDGTLEGPGFIGGISIDDILGKIQGGDAPGILNLSVPLTIESGGTMVAALNGTKAGTQYDQIISTSSVALGGTLDLQFGNGFSPSPTNSFAILSFASSTGSFAKVVTPSSTCAAKLTTTSTSLSVAFASSSVAVTISPVSVPLVEGAQQQFTDTVTNGCGNGVTWKVKEGAAGGKITAAGLYTAPAAAGTFHVIVTSVADPTKSATSTVTVTAAAADGKNLWVTPQAAVLQPGGSVHFEASQSVTWSVAEDATGGSISATGTYTAARTPGIYHVLASSIADATSHAVVNIAVVGGTLKAAYVANLEQNSVSVLTPSIRSGQASGPMSGPMSETQSIPTGQSPAGLAISPQGVLLTANRNSNDVSAFAVSAADATLEPVSGPVFDAGTGPSAVAWDPSGRLAFVTDADSDDISLFSAHGSAAQMSYLGKQALDAGDQPSAVAVDPSAPFVLVADSGGNNVHGFTFDLAGRLRELSGSPFAAGKGPAAAVTDPAGKFLFVANRASGDVSVFAIDGFDETLHEVDGSPFPAGKGPAAIATDITGSYVFVANHESNNISTFRIDSETGALALLNQTLLTIHGPTALAADPTGRYLFVTNDTTGGILNLALDVATGMLAPAGLITGPGKAAAIVLVRNQDEQTALNW